MRDDALGFLPISADMVHWRDTAELHVYPFPAVFRHDRAIHFGKVPCDAVRESVPYFLECRLASPFLPHAHSHVKAEWID